MSAAWGTATSSLAQNVKNPTPPAEGMMVTSLRDAGTARQGRAAEQPEVAACTDKLLGPNLPTLLADMLVGKLVQPLFLHA